MSSQSVLQKLSEIPMEVRPGVAEGLWDSMQSQFGATDIRRIRGLLECWAGVRPKALRANQRAMEDLYLPDLENDDPWLDPSHFRLATDLEASYSTLRDEYERLQQSGVPFKPYGRGPDDEATEPLPGCPVGWNEFPIMREFAPLRANSAQAPVAGRLAEIAIEYHDVVAHFTFLTLQPGAKLPLHCDPANFLVSCHLGIKVPAGCSLTVAGEERSWVEGKCIAFNNSYEHRAENKGTEVRAVLSTQVLHPALTPVERKAIAGLIQMLAQV